ncbi:MAG: beta-ketoacyl-ACP synthase III [Kofleriaceae bacterium]
MSTPSPRAPAARILGTGAFLPPIVRTNADLSEMVETSDEWIRERTGIRERRIAPDGMVTSDMATEAARRALEAAGLTAADVDLIIVGTVTPDMPMPATAAFVQQKLGCGPCPAFDLSAACAGFVYGLTLADAMIARGAHRHVLVIGVELLSRVVDWSDRTTCVLFGDGAGAVVLGPSDGSRGILATNVYTDSSLARSLMIPGGGSADPQSADVVARGDHKVKMKGQDIFRVAVKNLYSASQAVVDASGLSNADVDWVVPHQANLRIIDQVVARAAYAPEKVLSNIARVGNTSSASIPILLDESVRAGTIKPGDIALFCALGAGVSWGAALVRM